MQPRYLSAQDGRTLVLAALGGALEFYDFIIFVYFTATIGALFFPPDMPDWLRQLQTFGIFAAGYLARPLGGVLMAHFGDRGGRKRMFMFSVLLMAVPTLLMGLLPTYASIGVFAPLLLLILRILQGAAVGGEVPGAWVFVSEHVPTGRVGLACGVLTAGLTVGILLGSATASIVDLLWTTQQVLSGHWRVPFIVGGLFGLLALWLRRYLSETPVFQALRERRQLVEGLPIRQVLAGHRWNVIRCMVFSWLLTAGIVIVILMTPTLAQANYGVAIQASLHANMWATAALAFGCVLFGASADRFGVDRVLLVGCVAMIASTFLLFVALAYAPQYFAWVYPIAGFFVGVVGAVPVVLVHEFPPTIRYSGISLSYNLAYAISGGMTPIIVTLWLRSSPLAPAYYVAAVVAIAVIVVMLRLAGGLRVQQMSLRGAPCE
ncbi:MFS transporter [Steroidobacter agaridevorans]|uniref:MFS transporter n=1 Tax=Steroidobacter agaridevorans TaxID=2695856 RepID=A0A829YMH6_9GAMM|nr:MFS transporter [Steroidobacter agaridevorans]GFE84654.1 MFS transporter [Steroidobacter agaridevorans]